jgi:hypothetical protein
MILLDLNQVMISNLMMQLGNNYNQLEENLVRHMVLNSIRLYRTKFKEFGDLVICCDDKNYWRKDIFPYYKAHRKGDREKSDLDWSLLFDCLNKIRDELKENFPYKVVQVDRCEADDVIGTLCERFGTTLNNSDSERILVLSGDKDFAQLQKYANVEQFSPITKKWIRINNPEQFLQEHILKGDRGDGVPNFLSNDACIVNKERQKPLASKKIANWIGLDPKDFCNDVMLRNWHRNNALVNLSMVPQEYKDKINETYDAYVTPERKGMLNYFIKNKLKLLTEHIGEF